MTEAKPPAAPAEIAAWRDFCRRIEALGERVMSDEFPSDPGDKADGIQHLADQVSCWLGWVVGHSDTTAPFFHRSNDLVTQWGGPNQDNSYHHARIDPGRRYRIAGHMHGCDDFVLTLRAGFMHMPVWGTKATYTASEHGIRRGERFELLLGGDGSEEGWIAIPEEVTTASLREYYFEWSAEEPAIFTIECLDDVDPPPRLTGEKVAGQLGDAISQIENSLLYWNEYMGDYREQGTDNAFTEPIKVAKGLSVARYAFLFWDLEPEQALVVESDVPDARYWNFQTYNLAWFEQIEPVHRIGSINQSQAHVDADGRVRVVLSHRDPGVANWLDAGGHRVGQLTYRWFWPNSDPSPVVKVVDVGDVSSMMPAGAPQLDAAARREQVRRRKQHLALRFHT